MPMTKSPLLLDFPDSFETERLILSAPRPGDGAAINEAIVETFDALRRWMPWADHIPTVEENESYSRRAAASFLLRENLPLRMWHKADGLYAGGTGLHNIDWNVPCFEIGYWIRARYEGQGLVTEAVKGIVEFATVHLGAKRLEIRCDARNVRSANVARRAGFTLESTMRKQDIGADGSLRDTLVFVCFPGE